MKQKSMQKHRHNCGWPGTTKTRITFSDLFGGGQKVITGFCSVSCCSQISKSEVKQYNLEKENCGLKNGVYNRPVFHLLHQVLSKNI